MQAYFVKDGWLGDILQRDAYKVNMNAALVDRLARPDSPEAKQLAGLQSGPVFFYSKVSATEIDCCRVLGEKSFYLVDTNVAFEKALNRQFEPAGNCELRQAQPEDRQGVMQVAGSNFVYSRFHLDPHISQQTADVMKAEWAGNYFHGKRGDQMVVARVDGKVAGFLQLLHGKNDSLVIDLIAVDSSRRGKGIAADMIGYAEMSAPACRTIVVGTQVANIPSVRLYEKLGFRLRSSQYIFHYYNFPGEEK